MISNRELSILESQLSGELYFDNLMKSIYATDASVYRKMPLAVALPKDEKDLRILIEFAQNNNTSLIPRTAGTSLAGQCVGDGIVVDVSKYFNQILDFNERERTVTVQPGVVRDALNNFLKPYGLFFGPNTSTSNRCMIGGMVGNNSSGTTSIKYGVTRDKVMRLKVLLSDGCSAEFSELDKEAFFEKKQLDNLEGSIYKGIYDELSKEHVANEIMDQFPKPEIHRRNTGYAIDALINSQVFSGVPHGFNMCQLLTGSEGTLAFTTEITLQLDSLPPAESMMVVAHFSTINSCLEAVETVMKYDLYSCEMLDKTILDLTKHNKKQEANRQFIKGDPEAILMCEIRACTMNEARKQVEQMLNALSTTKLSYATSILIDESIDQAMELRKAGLGLLGNLIGDEKTAACIEDTAVALPDLANYIKDFTELMNGYNQKAIYYAHAGAGELHLRPILNLKKKSDVALFRKITTDVAHLVKKYNGSMSGEHGDGIVRSEFIPLMIGLKNYNVIEKIKGLFDPQNIFNPGKIVKPWPMDKALRYIPNREEPVIKTFLDFSESEGILRHAEKCNGSGDCRKLPEFGGTMCPSYRATRNEKDTTRARANALREILTQSEKPNKFNHLELKEVFDLCLSCKACATECPSSVDVSRLKAEFQYQFQRANGKSLRSKLFAYNHQLNRIGHTFPYVVNFVLTNKVTASLLKKSFGIHNKRSLPLISNLNLTEEWRNLYNQDTSKGYLKEVYLFKDEFTEYLDTTVGISAMRLLEALNYKVNIIDNLESGRALISKGFLEKAKTCADENVRRFKDKITETSPLIGIEPSAILTFKDEYLRLADDKAVAQKIASNTYLIEDFIKEEMAMGNITSKSFTLQKKTIKFHGHCHQKALSNQLSSFEVLNLPKNYTVTIIPSGCCGMAGSFGYEKEHYEVSMQIGEQTLFPTIRKADNDTIISANGTSCRHQIKDGTQREALHPIQILYDALIK